LEFLADFHIEQQEEYYDIHDENIFFVENEA